MLNFNAIYGCKGKLIVRYKDLFYVSRYRGTYEHSLKNLNNSCGDSYGMIQEGEEKLLEVSKNVKDIDIDVCNNSEFLIFACEFGYLDIITYLVHKGINVRTYEGAMLAVATNRLDVVKLLVKYGLNLKNDYINIRDTNYKIRAVDHLYLEACGRGHIELVKYFIEKGANLNIDKGYALFLAVTEQRPDITRYLLDKRIEIKKYEYIKFVKFSIYVDNLDIIKVLIENSPEPRLLAAQVISESKKLLHDNITDYLNSVINKK